MPLRPVLVIAWLMAAPLTAPMAAEAQPERGVTLFAGVMTDNVWEEAILPWQAEFIDAQLVGVAVNRDLARWGRLSFGIEGQIVAHAGRQRHLEVNLPLYARLHLPQGWFAPDSLSFGFGLSHASRIPQVEIDRDGASTRTMFYWMAEAAFDLPGDELSLIARLHHRSDGYGVFPEDAGSNALVLGLRRRF